MEPHSPRREGSVLRMACIAMFSMCVRQRVELRGFVNMSVHRSMDGIRSLSGPCRENSGI